MKLGELRKALAEIPDEVPDDTLVGVFMPCEERMFQDHPSPESRRIRCGRHRPRAAGTRDHPGVGGRPPLLRGGHVMDEYLAMKEKYEDLRQRLEEHVLSGIWPESRHVANVILIEHDKAIAKEEE